MAPHPRYREEAGVPCIDVRVARADQLFDLRDPAPFRERDLDAALVELLEDASEDLLAHAHVRIVLWIEEVCDAAVIEAAIRAHVRYDIERLDRRRARSRRAGTIALAIALGVGAVLLSLSQLVARSMQGTFAGALEEALVITCWVLVWRPIEILVYDWVPFRRRRHVLQRLVDAPIEVRRGTTPRDASGGPVS